ncbi:signal recognition particle subunit SRP68 [Trichechus manatus latirostris]|uniref:Signal recognition particle subunit SRP68 n=1 Tax=Trichechus manatus latirostris TaxID=127582 RepID=A0A2Y9R0R5_TRIMA|nr:signal recognition particle subunit SRP68 [Trichechus manatus latirostris]
MAAEKQVPGGSGGGGSGGSGGGRGAGGEENKENERPSAGSKANKEFGDSLSLEILQIIKESQQQHGLRHGDFQRYRGYCSRRQRRLRKTLNFKMGNRHKFTGKKVTEDLLTDNRYLLLILMDAERAWSYAMQLKQEANTEPRKRFHLLSRLRKAVKHAEELERLCESNRVDAKTKLEAQAYTAYLAGMLRFEHQEWKAAIEAFNKCKTIYEKLASAFTEEQAVLYSQRVEEISPNIRYCAYNIGDQSAINELMQMRLRSGGTEGLLAEKLEALISQTRAKQAATMSEVLWRGRTVPVKIDKVRIFLLGLADNEEAITQVRRRAHSGLLCKQRDYSLDGESAKVSNLQYLHRCFFIAQSYVLVKKWSEALVLYDRVLKYADEVNSDDNHEAFENSLKVRRCPLRVSKVLGSCAGRLCRGWEGRTTDEAFLRKVCPASPGASQKCRLSGRTPDLLSQNLHFNKIPRGFGCTLKLKKHCSKGHERLRPENEWLCPDASDSHQTETSSQVKDNKPLVERFETFCLDPSLVTKQASLVHFPPGFQPIPCKPLFFDLALNHVAFPPLEDKLEQKTKSGLTGYIKGIFGFRS